MTAKTDTIPTGLNRFNALLAWWGAPDGLGLGSTEAQTKRFQILVTELGQAFNEASSCQVETLSATNERLACSLQELLRSRQPQELMAAQSSVVASLVEGLAAQTKVWADLTQKVHGCCATMVREAADDAAKQSVSAASAATQGQSEPPVDREAAKGTAATADGE